MSITDIRDNACDMIYKDDAFLSRRGHDMAKQIRKRLKRKYAMSELMFARPTFWGGIARLMDFGNSLSEFNYSTYPELTDTMALASDWRAVGFDLQNAIDTVTHEKGMRVQR